MLGGTRLYWEELDCTGWYYTVMGSTRMYRVGLMSLLMIHEAYMPVYMGSRFSLRVYGRAGPPEVVQEALADLKVVKLRKISQNGGRGALQFRKGGFGIPKLYLKFWWPLFWVLKPKSDIWIPKCT